MSKSQAYMVLTAALIVICAVAYFLFSGASLPTLSGMGGPKAPPPPPSKEVREMLEKSKGFAALVSYTDRGFEPRRVVIKQGEAVRFTNNSSGTLLWVASTSTSGAYPGVSECGGSEFDTCKTLRRGEFWEFTFDVKGVWHYRNNSDPTKEGIVEVL